MKINFILIVLLLGLHSTSIGQKLIDTSKSKNLPYHKYQGMQLLYLSFTGGGAYNTANNDNLYIITASPRYGYYISSKIEFLGEYAFSYLKLGSLSPIRSKTFHQFAVTGRYFPFKKYNFIHLEAGVQTGNYTTTKPERNTIDVWSNNAIIGFGIEILPKKRKYVLDYNVRYVIPFNSNYNSDFVRLLGFGITLKN